ncbi:MAG: adenosylcobinamide-GDP ribazoletransferase, partial [Ilumatobacteraceae bacterium]
SRTGAVVGVVAAVGFASLATGWWAAPLAATAAVAALIVTTMAVRAFDGVSGDILGAIEQVVECSVLVVVTGLAARHPIWWA